MNAHFPFFNVIPRNGRAYRSAVSLNDVEDGMCTF